MSDSLSELTQLGRYKLTRELGRGGMSVVYLACDTELGRDVAIKCVDRQDQEKAKLAERLRAEAQLLAQLNHSNIVQLYDVVEEGHILGLVIEYIGGNTLTQRLKDAPTKEIKLKWLAEIADGLAKAHSKGIAHCDLKTDNVLITDDNIAKIADFGIAKVKLDDYLKDDHGLTHVDSVSGSYFSLSPEQATGQAVDTRTDLFSFAILAFQSLVGEHPFGDTTNKVALLQRVINDPFELNPEVAASLGPRLVDVVSNLLSKAPTERIYNAQEAADLIRSEQQNTLSLEQDDRTVIIETLPPSTTKIITPFVNSKWRSISSKALLLVAGFLVGVALLKTLHEPNQNKTNINYIALDTIEVTANEGFNKAQLPLIKATLQQSVENTVLSFQQTGLVDDKELNSVAGSYSKRAKAAKINDILSISANCFSVKCDIKIQHRTGERMAIANQVNYPVSSNLLVEMGNSLENQITTLFHSNNLQFFRKKKSISENSYRSYLDLLISSKSGSNSNEKHFHEVQKLIKENPAFNLPYALAYRISRHLDQNSGGKARTTLITQALNMAPASVKRDRLFRRTQIQTLVDIGNIKAAKIELESLETEYNDALFLNEIKSYIAYAENDYSKLIELDRKNAEWRPSLENLYNLSASEYSIGNYSAAIDLLNRVLKEFPGHPYALELKATIEVHTGSLSKAINTYKALLKEQQDGSLYTNYGVVLALSGDYDNAVLNQEKALEINANSPLYRINLADAYTLQGSPDLAEQHYKQVVEILTMPKTAQEYGFLAQAQAHLGLHSKSVKTLKTANKKFPNYAELDYASSIVNTLAGNYISATVDVSDSINRGTAPVWFSFSWFKPLCGQNDFLTLTRAVEPHLCSK